LFHRCSRFRTTRVIRPGTTDDIDALLALQQTVAGESATLARAPDELTRDHVASAVTKSLATGVFLLASEGVDVVGAIYCYALGPRQFAHVLGELTVAVRRAHQGQGIGRRLFEALLEQIRSDRPDVTRVELLVRSDNVGAQRLYTSVGFREEGRLRDRIRLPDGTILDDVMMAWHRVPVTATS
jgi:ribosomal protein S18 acetylase RimI-like enzyme